MPSWVVKADFGTGFITIDPRHVEKIIRETSIHRDLKTTIDTCKIEVTEKSLALAFQGASGNIPVEIDRDGVAYFRGVVRPNHNRRFASQFRSMDIEVVDYLYTLQIRITSDFVYSNIPISDPSNTTNSFLHQLFTRAGIASAKLTFGAVGEVITEIAVSDADNVTYWELLNDVLWEYGYVVYQNPDGTFGVYNLFPTAITFGSLTDSTPIFHGASEERREYRYQKVRINYNPIVTKTDVILWSDTTGQSENNKCNITLLAGEYYPPNSQTYPAYAKYTIDDYEFIRAYNVTLDYTAWGGLTVNKFVAGPKRAEICFYASTAGTITKLDIKGTAVLRDTARINRAVRIITSGSDSILEHDAKYLDTEAKANRLASGLADWYTDGIYTYKFQTDANISRGEYYKIDSATMGIAVDCRVLSVKEGKNSIKTVELEAVAPVIITVDARESDFIPAPNEPQNQKTVSDVQIPTIDNIETGTKDDGTDLYIAGTIVAGRGIKSSTFVSGSQGWAINGAGDAEFNQVVVRGTIYATVGNIGGWGITASTLQSGTDVKLDATNKRISIKTDVFGNAGIQLEYNAGTPRLHVGNGTKYLKFDGTNLLLNAGNTSLDASGNLTTVSGNIGGWGITSSTLQSGADIKLDAVNKRISIKDDIFGNAGIQLEYNAGTPRLHVGNGTKYLKFDGTNLLLNAGNTSLDASGNLTTVSGNIGGFSITANTLQNGADIKLDATSKKISIKSDVFGTAGIQLEYNSGAPRFFVGSATKYIKFDGTNLLLAAGNTSLDAAGNLTTVSGNIGTWLITAETLQSKPDGQARIELNPTDNRIEVWSDTGPRVAVGYLGGLSDPANRLLVLPSTTYGFWTEEGDRIELHGDMVVKDGQYQLEDDASIEVIDGVTAKQLLRLGTDAGIKGLHFYDLNPPTGTLKNSIRLIGDILNITGALTIGGVLTATGNAVVGGDLQVNGGDIGISTDPDILHLAANALTVNGELSTTNNGRNYYVNKKLAGYSSTENSAGVNYILLHKAYDGTVIGDHHVFGIISAIRGATGAWNRKLTINVNTASAYNSDRGSLISYNEAAQLVTLRYGGVKYVAVQISSNSALSNLVFTGWAYVADGEMLKLVYDQDVTEVLPWTASDASTVSGSAIVGGNLQVNGRNLGINVDADLLHLAANALTVNGALTTTSNTVVGGALQVNGGDIGISGDTDLIHMAASLLTVNGALEVDTLSTLVGGSEIVQFKNESGRIGIGSGTPSYNTMYGNYILSSKPDGTYTSLGLKTNAGVPQFILDTSGNASITGDLQVNGGDIGLSGDTDLIHLAANLLTVNGALTATGNGVIGGDLQVNGGDIGLSGDTDLIHMAANLLTVNGALTVTGNLKIDISSISSFINAKPMAHIDGGACLYRDRGTSNGNLPYRENWWDGGAYRELGLDTSGFYFNDNLRISGDLQVNGGDIGISTDTDLIHLADNLLTVNGGIYKVPRNHTNDTSNISLNIGETVYIEISTFTTAKNLYISMPSGTITNPGIIQIDAFLYLSNVIDAFIRLYPNNTYYTGAFTSQVNTATGNAAKETVNGFEFDLTVGTATTKKQLSVRMICVNRGTSIPKTVFLQSLGGINATLIGTSQWNNTTTTWSSLGQFTFNSVDITGRIYITRLA